MTDWAPAVPTPEQQLTAFPICEDSEFADVAVVGAKSTDPLQLERFEVANVSLQDCDVIGVVIRGGRVSRLLVEQSRLRSAVWMDGTLQDLTFDGVTAADVSFRFSTLRRAVFRNCTLSRLDLTEVTIDRVRFERCDLSGARFDGAKATSLRIEECDLTGCTGAEALRGGSVDPRDLISLAPSLAVALGIKIE